MQPIDTGKIITAQVMERYGLKSRTTLNDWLERAAVKSFKDGRETYIWVSDLPRLDAIAAEMKRSINPPTEPIEPIQSIQPIHPTHPAVSNLEIVLSISELKELFQMRHSLDLYQKLELLEAASKNGWYLRSKEVAQILDLKNAPSSPYQGRGFLFERSGRWWKVTKES